MPVFKRWKGRRITSSHSNYKDARWTAEFRVAGRKITQALPNATTKAQALSAEAKLKDDAHNRRFGRGGSQVGFSKFVDERYLPWALKEKKSYYDDNSRAKLLKEFFTDTPIGDIRPFDVERLTDSLLGKKTPKGPRSETTVNRYFALLSTIFTRAMREGIVENNPCSGIEKSKEQSRDRYLTHEEEARLTNVLVGDLAFLTRPIAIALGAGLRKGEMLKLKAGHVNLSGLTIFCGKEVLPGWLFAVDPKNGQARQVPMNSTVRSALTEIVADAAADDPIFSFRRNGISVSTLKRGFEAACNRAKIPYGEKTAGGLIWHDLRRTFATRLRAAGVHQYDIMDLLGHTIAGVTATYARVNPEVLEQAVERLTEKRGELLRFERKVG
jgi:integrase